MNDREWNTLVSVIRGEQLHPLPTAFIIDSPWLPNWAGHTILDYFTSDRIFLDDNFKAIDAFPQTIFLPGFWSEYGMCTEPSAFGSVSIWGENDFPFAMRVLRSPEEVDRLAPPDPRRHGLLPFVIARDSGARYIQAATEGRPEAIQVADRWHLMENASAAFLTAVQRSMQVIRKALGANVIDPAHLSCAERRQHSGWLRREEENAAILALAKQGMAIKEIVRRTSKSRGLVRQEVRGGRTVAIIEAAVPALVTARNLMDRFHGMNQSRMSAELEPWITDAMPGLLGSFAKGIVQDRAAVHAALTQPWSNGQTEGQNTKLKLVKRQMYGRANLDLLHARLLGPT